MIMVKSVSRTIMKEMELKNLLPLKKKTTQILLSISIFSFFFSWCSSNLLHYFPYNPFHVSNFPANKNCIFLLCNGILVLVANSSAAVRHPSAADVSDMLQKKIGDTLLLEPPTQPEEENDHDEEEEQVVLSDNKHIVLDENDGDEGEENVPEEGRFHATYAGTTHPSDTGVGPTQGETHSHVTKVGSAHEGIIEFPPEEMHREIEHSSSGADQVEKEDADRNDPRDSSLFDDDGENRDEEEEEEVDEIEKLSTEELNQRFEDFIRRMKQEFRVINDYYEKQQLVMVK